MANDWYQWSVTRSRTGTSGSLGDRAVADIALVIESTLTAVGFAVIVYSLYTE